MPNLWTYNQDFETLTAGDLNGQDSWSGNAAFDVSTDAEALYSGSKGIKVNGNNTGVAISRTITGVASGTFYISMKLQTTNNLYQVFRLYNGASYGIAVGLWTDGTISYWNGSDWTQIGSLTYEGGTWYRIGVQFECGSGGWEGLSADTFKINVNNGAWSSALNFSTALAQVDKIELETYNSDASHYGYWDTISPNYSGVANNGWTYEQKFNLLNTAALSGQDSWSAIEGTINVVTTAPYEGSKCVSAQTESISRALPSALASGTFYISVKAGATNGSAAVLLLNNSGVSDIDLYWKDDGKIYGVANGDVWTEIGSYTTDWMRIGVAFECGYSGWAGLSAGYYKVNINNGAWSSPIQMYRASRTTLNTIRLYRYGGDTHYYDYISYNYSVSQVKKIAGVTQETIKKIAGIPAL